MTKKLKRVSTLLVAFYTICSNCSVKADTSIVTSAQLRKQLNASSSMPQGELRELTSDYLFALKEEGATPTEQLTALLRFTQPKSDTQLVFYRSPVLKAHWMSTLYDFHINDLKSLETLNMASEACASSIPQNISKTSAATLIRLAEEIDRLKVSTPKHEKLKLETLWHLAQIGQANKEFGKTLSLIAAAQIVRDKNFSAERGQQAFALLLPSYYNERPHTSEDGKRFRDAVVTMIDTANQTANKVLLQAPESIFGELVRRCSISEALSTQQQLVNCAENLKFEESTLASLRWQLVCAYMLANKNQHAVEILRNYQDNQNPFNLLCLAECMRRQKKFKEADRLAVIIKTTNFSPNYRFPSQYAAIADAIHAQSLIDQGLFSKSLAFLISADDWYSKSVSLDNDDVRSRPFLWKIFPDGTKVLSNLALVYAKTNRPDKAAWALGEIERSKESSFVGAIKRDRDELYNAAKYEEIGEEKALKQAIQFTKTCIANEKSNSKKAELLFEYAEILIRKQKLEAAEFCLNELAKDEFREPTMNAESSDRIRLYRSLLALARNDSLRAKNLLDARLKEKRLTSTSDTQLRSEIAARLALSCNDYELAEVESRPIEMALDTVSSDSAISPLNDSAQDNFAKNHYAALCDRVGCLIQLKKFKPAAQLARRISLLENVIDAGVTVDALACLAVCYELDGHKGLAEATRHEAVSKMHAIPFGTKSRYLAEAKLQLAALEDLHNSPFRAQRYRAEFKELIQP